VDSRPAATSGWNSLCPWNTLGHRSLLARLGLGLQGCRHSLRSPVWRQAFVAVVLIVARQKPKSCLPCNASAPAKTKKPAPNKQDLSGLSCPARASFWVNRCQEREQSPGYSRCAPIVTYFTEDSIEPARVSLDEIKFTSLWVVPINESLLRHVHKDSACAALPSAQPGVELGGFLQLLATHTWHSHELALNSGNAVISPHSFSN